MQLGRVLVDAEGAGGGGTTMKRDLEDGEGSNLRKERNQLRITLPSADERMPKPLDLLLGRFNGPGIIDHGVGPLAFGL